MLFKEYLGFNTQHKFRFYVKPFLEKQSFNCLFPSYIVIECISWCCSATKSCLMLCDPMNYSMPGFPVLHYLPEFAQTQCPLSQRCHPPITFSVSSFSSCLQSFPGSESFPKSWLFTSVGQSIGASTSLLPMNSELLSFRINWFDLLAVQGTLKSLLQHQGSKASILVCWTFLMVQLTSVHDYWEKHSFD